MWGSTSNSISGTLADNFLKRNQAPSEFSDDEISLINSREEGLECPICWESFNIVENVPYILWCGHTLCKNCVLGLRLAVMKLPTLPIQLPFFVSCPWCNILSFRLVYKGNLKFPRKKFFLFWMVEGMNGKDRSKSHTSFCVDHQPVCSSKGSQGSHVNYNGVQHAESNGDSHHNTERLHISLRKSLVLVVHLMAKFPLVFIFLLIVLYAFPASVAILALYMLTTVLFAVPSFLVLYFSYPSLDWLVREIIT